MSADRGLSGLRIEASSRPSSATPGGAFGSEAAHVAESPVRAGGGHSSRSPRARTPVRLEEALLTSRQVSISVREERASIDISDAPSADSPPAGSGQLSPALFVAEAGVTSEIGARPENQDGWILCERFAGHEGAVFAAVLDGHGSDGRRVAQFVQSALPEVLAAQPDLLSEPPAALTRAFAQTQARLLAPESGLQTACSGATATCILVVRRRLHVAK